MKRTGESLKGLSGTGQKNTGATKSKKKPTKTKKPKLYKTRQARERHGQALTKKMIDDKFKHYKIKLDTVHSRYVRSKGDSCVTCGSKETIQNGHRIGRRHYRCRWEDWNTHPQCARCNCHLHGNYNMYCLFISETYGAEFMIEKLSKIRGSLYKNKKPSIDWMRQQIALYQAK